VTVYSALLLLLIANGAPVVAWKLLGARFGYPLDGGAVLGDGRRLFGPSKTIRGVVAAVAASALAATMLGVEATTGALLGLWAMAGDLASSLVKRRLGIAPSAMAVGLDQIPESLLPLLALRARLDLQWTGVAEVILAFVVLELLLSQVLFRLHLRKRPY
jgi:CDP-diglyceride synthetase